MQLPQPRAPFEHLVCNGESISIDGSWDTIVLPTGMINTLPEFNEYTLRDGRTLVEGTYIFEKDSLYGIYLQRNFVCVYNSSSKSVYFFIFCLPLHKLEFVINNRGLVTTLTFSPGNSSIYYGLFRYPDLLTDSNSDNIPDFLDESITGSLTKFLNSYCLMTGDIYHVLLDAGAPSSNSSFIFDGGGPSSNFERLIDGGIL